MPFAGEATRREIRIQRRLETEADWFAMAPQRLRSDGIAVRLGVPFADRSLLTLLLSTSGRELGLSFDYVEPLPGLEHDHDPRLGRILIDSHLLRLGVVETVTYRHCFSALTLIADDETVAALLYGQKLEFAFPERRLRARLNGFRPLLEQALRTVCDPERIPLERWLRS